MADYDDDELELEKAREKAKRRAGGRSFIILLLIFAVAVVLVSLLTGAVTWTGARGAFQIAPEPYAINAEILVVVGAFFCVVVTLASMFESVAKRTLVAFAALVLGTTVIALLLAPMGGWVFAVGVALNLGIIWSVLAVRNVLRRRRLQIVVYLSEFLFDAHDEKNRPIEPASLRMALEKYLFESDSFFVANQSQAPQPRTIRFGINVFGWGRSAFPDEAPKDAEKDANENRRKAAPMRDLYQWLDWRRGVATELRTLKTIPPCAQTEAQRTRIIELEEELRHAEFKMLLSRASDFVNDQGRIRQEMRAFLNWAPAYLPFVFLAGFFFTQFAPAANDLIAGLGRCAHCTTGKDWGAYWHATQAPRTPVAFVVATFAFAGAYLRSLTDIVNGVVSYDIGATTFLRAFRHSIAAIAVAVVSWYALNTVHISFGDAPPTTGPATAAPAAAFLVIAFIIGIYPDLGLGELIRRSNLFGMKQRNDPLAEKVKTTPLELLDGIDYNTRLRLEELGVVDVQNLATANPILLFAETPMFGLYQSIDWIAQAQLCLAVGPDCFLTLKNWRLRTIFDLERVLVDPQTPDHMRLAAAAAIFDGAENVDKIRAALRLDAASAFSSDDGKAAPNSIKTAMAMGHVIMDDLHVRRLRQIWKIVRERLGGEFSETLFPETRPADKAEACCEKARPEAEGGADTMQGGGADTAQGGGADTAQGGDQ